MQTRNWMNRLPWRRQQQERGFTMFDGLWADVRYAFRSLLQQPAFTAVAVISLALGIGANSAVFSLADALLLRPLPVFRPSEVLSVTANTPGNPYEGMSYPDYRAIREQSRSFSGLVAFRITTVGAATTPAAPPQMRTALMASDNFFTVLGVAPALGRPFRPEEATAPGRDPVALLGYDCWRNQFGSSPSVIGQAIRLNGVDFTIIGVAPESFTGMDQFLRPAVLVPLSMWGKLGTAKEEPLEDRTQHELIVKGRLNAGVSRASAQAELMALGNNLASAYPKTNRERHMAVRTELEMRIEQSPPDAALIMMLMVLVGLVLIIACSNVANLLLARARARSREIATRLAIGAGRGRIVRQLMTESLMVAILGGVAGLGFAYGGIQFFRTIPVPSDLPIVFGVQLDTRVLLFSLAASLASCLLFGLAPALQATRTELMTSLKSRGDAVSSRPRTKGRNVLVVGQIALAMVLLIAAGMLLDGFRKMLLMNPGFRTDHVISMELDPSLLRYSPEQTRDFYRKLVGQVRLTPGVISVALAETMPLSNYQSTINVVPEGYQFPKGQETVMTLGGAFDGEYFYTMRAELVRGRAFNTADRAGSKRVAIVNEEFARIYWPKQDAVGKRLRLERTDGEIAEVVGVAKTSKYIFIAERPTPYVYLAYEQSPRSRMNLIAETQGDPAALAEPMRQAVRGLDANQPVYNVRTVASFYERRAISIGLLLLQTVATMGLLGLILAMVGLYGLVSYSVSLMTPEIGIRIAIGASRIDVLRLVLRQGLILSAAGIAVGGALTALSLPMLASGLVGFGVANLNILIAVPLALLLVCWVACYVPARRATRLDPIRALRYE